MVWHRIGQPCMPTCGRGYRCLRFPSSTASAWTACHLVPTRSRIRLKIRLRIRQLRLMYRLITVTRVDKFHRELTISYDTVKKTQTLREDQIHLTSRQKRLAKTTTCKHSSNTVSIRRLATRALVAVTAHNIPLMEIVRMLLLLNVSMTRRPWLNNLKKRMLH